MAYDVKKMGLPELSAAADVVTEIKRRYKSGEYYGDIIAIVNSVHLELNEAANNEFENMAHHHEEDNDELL